MASEPIGPHRDHTHPSGRLAGIVIALGSLLSVAFMAFHPTIEARDTTELIAEVTREAPLNGIVHGSLIVLIALLVYGFTCLASRLGMGSAFVRAGLIAYVAGALAMATAALVSGFIVPDFVARYQDRPPQDLEMMRHVLALGRVTNQVCARGGVLAMSIAFALWSIPLLRRPGEVRMVGVLGCVVGALPIIALLAGHLPMNVHGVGAFVLAQAMWSVTIALLLIRNRL